MMNLRPARARLLLWSEVLVVGLIASGHSPDEILKLYPYLEKEDLPEALSYAAWRAEEVELLLVTG
ncbi:MAG TPA: DUF433 domain-containing protein [Pyrinomonadaceae bacterium]|nr:DUF433 domain-containing protein [Pyrinomonadaceae bacterium]